MHTTILIEGRQVGIEISDAVLHIRGDFCGNLDVPLTFDHPITTETVVKHLRIKLLGNDKLYDVIATGEKVGGLEVCFFILDDDPSRDSFPPDKIPNMVELLWVEENMPTRLGEVTVQTMAEEPDSEPESPKQPSSGSGCAGVILAVASGVLLLAGLAGCPNETLTTEAELVSWYADTLDKTELEEGRIRKVDRIRYRVTVTCLEDGKLPAAKDHKEDEGSGE